MKKYMKKAFLRKGFSFIEVISQCPVYYGRLNKIAKPYDMLTNQKDILVSKDKYETLSSDDKFGKLPIGEFIEDNSQPSYLEKESNF